MDTMPDAFAPAQMGSSAAPANFSSNTGTLGNTGTSTQIKVDGALILTRELPLTTPRRPYPKFVTAGPVADF